MATPKRVKREERDYADIYQENFVRNNDPAALGQAAFTRQLSSGIQRNMGQERLAANTAMPPVVPGLSGAGGQAQATGMQRAIIEQDALIAKERREDELRRGVSATQRAGYSPVDTAQMAMDRRAGAMARAEQGDGIGLGGMPTLESSQFDVQRREAFTNPVQRGPGRFGVDERLGSLAGTYTGAISPTQSGYTQADPVPRQRAAQARAEQGDYLAGNTMPSIEKATNAEEDAIIAERRAAEARRKAAEARAAQGEMILPGNTLPSLEQMTGDAYTAPTPGEVDYTGAGLQPDYTGAGLQPDALQRAREEEKQVIAEEEERDRLRTEGGDTTPEPVEGDGQTDNDGNQITLSGASASYDAGIRDEETRLNEQLDAEVEAVLQNYNQRYNQFMQLAINRGAVRGNLEQQGFTGGIGQQIQDYLSTQEMVALDALMRERDQALQAIELERGNIPDIAKTNYIQSLQLESATSEARLAFSQQLSQRVLDGSMSLAEANGLAQEYGLQDVQSVFQTAIEAQIAAGTMDKAGAIAELERLGLDTSFLDEQKTYENWQMSNEATQLENRMMAVLNNIPDSDWGEKVGTVMAGVAAGSIFPGPGWIIGGIAGLYAAFEQDVNKADMSKVSSSLMASDLMMNEGPEIWNGDFSSLEITKPAGQATSNAAQQEYLITVDGTQYSMEGADIMALAVALKAGSYSKTQYKALFNTAKTIFNNMPADPGGAFDSVTGGRYSTIKKIYDKTF